MRTILIVLILTVGAYGASIYYRGDSYTIGNRVETTEQDTKVSGKHLKGLQERYPKRQVYGVVTSVSSEGWFLLIRCVVKTRDRPVREVLAELDVESYNPASSNYRRVKSFNIAISDTIPANDMRTYVFRKHISIIEASNDPGLQMLWNRHLRIDDTGSFRWTFDVRRIR